MRRWDSNMAMGRARETPRVNLMTYKYKCMIMALRVVGRPWMDHPRIQVCKLKPWRTRILISKGGHRLRVKEKQLRLLPRHIFPNCKRLDTQRHALSTWRSKWLAWPAIYSWACSVQTRPSSTLSLSRWLRSISGQSKMSLGGFLWACDGGAESMAGAKRSGSSRSILLRRKIRRTLAYFGAHSISSA